MKGTLVGHHAWTPEEGPLRVDAELASVSRWGRALIEVVERAASDEPPWPTRTCVVIGSTTESSEAERVALMGELGRRWDGCEWVVVEAGASTVPMSLMEALARTRRFDAVAWASVELTAGAELATAVWLTAEGDGSEILVERDHAPRPANPRSRRLDLNPCSAALDVVRGIGSESVSIRVDEWRIDVISPGLDRQELTVPLRHGR